MRNFLDLDMWTESPCVLNRAVSVRELQSKRAHSKIHRPWDRDEDDAHLYGPGVGIQKGGYKGSED